MGILEPPKNGLAQNEIAALLEDYEHCNEGHRQAICRFAHTLAEMESRPQAEVIPFLRS